MAEAVIRVGVIGLGAMGYQMARHMVAKGFTVTGYDISPEANEKAAGVGVTISDTPEGVANAASVVIVMVATGAQIENAILHSGLLDRLESGAVVCIASSCSMEMCQDIEAKCAALGIGLLDTPVVLGQEAANNGTLTAFVGGTRASFEKAAPVLRAFSGQVMHVGDSGTGQLTKTINNMLLWACMSANYEVLSFAKKVGADVPKLITALEQSSGANWSLSRWGRSTGKWAEKDMDVALDLAQAVQHPVPLSGLVDQLMKGMNQEKMKALLE